MANRLPCLLCAAVEEACPGTCPYRHFFSDCHSGMMNYNAVRRCFTTTHFRALVDDISYWEKCSPLEKIILIRGLLHEAKLRVARPKEGASMRIRVLEDYASSLWNDMFNPPPQEETKPLLLAHPFQENEDVPFVGGEVTPFSVLAAEYDEGSHIMRAKIQNLAQNYTGYRKIAGDGNCFYRAFMFAYLELIQQSRDTAEVDRIADNIEECNETIKTLGICRMTYHVDSCQAFLKLIDQSVGSLSHEELVNRSCDKLVSNKVVEFLRLVTAAEMLMDRECFGEFIDGEGATKVDEYCKSHVLPLGQECENPEIKALTDALAVPVRIEYINNTQSKDGDANQHNFVPRIPSASSMSSVPANLLINLLYRPGHYDVLYRKQ